MSQMQTHIIQPIKSYRNFSLQLDPNGNSSKQQVDLKNRQFTIGLFGSQWDQMSMQKITRTLKQIFQGFKTSTSFFILYQKDIIKIIYQQSSDKGYTICNMTQRGSTYFYGYSQILDEEIKIYFIEIICTEFLSLKYFVII